MAGLIIAVDGYSSTGKSTFAKIIARMLDLVYLDSGALYRTVTLFALENGMLPEDGTILEEALEEALSHGIDISFARREGGDGHDIMLEGRNVAERIRMLDISQRVSPVAALPFVRAFVDTILHRLGADGCVMDGRDIGTAVFPDADLKIFMTADAAIRARRRLKEMEEKGEEADFDEVYKNVLERDYIDSHRETNPLRMAEDAILLDNGEMSLEDEVEWLKGVLREKFSMEL